MTCVLRLEAASVLSYAMAYNRVPIVDGITVSAAGGGVCDGEVTLVVIDDEGPLSKEWVRSVTLPDAGSITIRSIDLVLDWGQVSQLAERRPARYECMLRDRSGAVLATTTAPVDVLAPHQWRASPLGLGLEMLAAHVMPNAPEIGELVSYASTLLGATTGSPSIQGYQDGPERVDQIVRAIYETMQAGAIRYSEPPPSWADDGQKIRTPAEVLAGTDGRGGLATCLDTTLVMAAALEHAGIRPLVVVTQGHAFLAYWRAEVSLPLVAQRDTNDLVNRMQLGQVGLVETTGVCDGIDLPWNVAVRRPFETELMRPADDILGVMDVWTARQNRIIPLPARGRTVDGAPVVVEYRAEIHTTVARSDGDDAALPAANRTAMPPRFLQWQNALIDLSLRNPLLNLSSRTGLRLAAPGALGARIDDRIASGKRLVVLPYDGLGAMQAARMQATSVAGVEEQIVRDLFARSGAVVADVSAASYGTTFRNLAYKARTVLEEMGANALHLTLGELVWQQDGKEIRSPLVLTPVHVRPTAGERSYEIVPDDTGQATPNFCLAEKLRQSHGITIPALEDPPTDAGGIDLEELFTSIRLTLAEHGLPFRVDAAARLAVVQFAKFRLWRDIADSWELMLQSPLVRHLALTPTHDFADPAPERGPVDLDTLGALCPIPADASQVGAIGAALQGRTFVLEGPPGTGKSQTITNLLARAVADGQRVLFVAEKQAALEVVKRRLDDVGLASISLDLHDKSAKPAAIRRQIQQALDLVADSDEARLASTRQEQDARRRPLARYVDAIHATNGAGLSLYTAVGTPGITDVSPMPVPVTAVVPEAAAAIDRARAAVRLVPDVADRVGPAPSPWGFALSPPAAVVPEQVRVLAVAYENQLDRCAAAVGPWAAVLDGCRTPGEVRGVASLLGLPDVSAGAIDVICSDSWAQLLAAARADVRRYSRAGLGAMASSALDLDLDALMAEADAAARSFFLFRKGRLGRVGDRLARHVLPGRRLDPHEVIPTLTALLAAREQARTVRVGLTDRLPNLMLDDAWNPWRPDAEGQVVAAAEAVRVRAAVADPRVTRPDLATAVRDLLPETGSVSAVVRDEVATLADALDGLGRALGIDDRDAARWSRERGFGTTWRTTASRRVLPDAGCASLRAWLAFVGQVAPLRESGLSDAATEVLSGGIDADFAALALEAGLVEASVLERQARGQTSIFDVAVHERAVDRYRASADALRLAERDGLLDTALRRRTFAATADVGRVGSLRRDVGRRRGGKSVRQLLSTYADLIAEIMPCALVSPDSVARFYPVRPGLFDLVVFDEASQIKVADAIGAIARAKAVVIVGDSKQMPPTSFAEVIATTDDESGMTQGTVADEESILSECVQAGLDRHWLSWHYRSQDESLIAFSNATYYEGRLSSFPAPVRGSADPGVDGHGVSLVRVQGEFLRSGKGKDLRTNPVEAAAIVAEITARFDAVPDGAMPSIGVVTFNVQQRGLIEALIRDSGDHRLIEALDSSREGLFVKNLENVQGDERDVILFSTAFSVNERGVLPLNFGPLNLVGGERRLNVAITRARRQVLVFSSFDPQQLRAEETTSVGVKHLRAYLELAAAGSPLSALATVRAATIDRHRDEVAARLRAAGLAVTTDVGLSDFRIDLCLARADAPDVPLVAVLLDSVAWGRRRTVADRYELPGVVLDGLLRWPVVTWVWLPDWLAHPDDIVRRLVALTEGANPADEAPAWQQLPGSADDDDDIDEPTPEPHALEPGAVTVRGMASAPDPVQDPTPTGTERPAVTLSGESEFVGWTVSPAGPRSVLDALPERWAGERVAAVVVDVLAAEGPAHRDRVVSLVARAFDLTRVAGWRADAILATVGIRPEVIWLWPASINEATWRGFRRTKDARDRPLDHVPEAEIVNAACAVALTTRGAGRDDLVKATLSIFGISRRGARTGALVEDAIDRALASGRLRLDGDLLVAT